MKRLFCIAVFALCFVCTAVADEAAESILKDIERNLAAMGAYRVEFEVVAGDYRSTGEYVVAGRDFYLRADDTEVYVSGGVRREASHSKKEVTIDTADTSARDIISNPSAGFSVLLEDFDSVTASSADGEQHITLVPKGESSAHESVTVVVAKDGKFPKSITYNTASGAIEVRLLGVEPASGGVPRFDKTKYEGYEMVDFR